MCVWCSLCNGYHYRKWIGQPEFKSLTRLFVFHIVPIRFGKGMNTVIFPPAMDKNNWADWAL